MLFKSLHLNLVLHTDALMFFFVIMTFARTAYGLHICHSRELPKSYIVHPSAAEHEIPISGVVGHNYLGIPSPPPFQDYRHG